MSLKDLLEALRRSRWALRLAGVGLVGVSLALLVVLRTLPYSSCRLTSVSAAEAARRPTPDFTLGPLSWPVTQLKDEPELGPFRAAFRTDCGDATGLPAATCAATALARRSPIGNPATEFIDRGFDPVKHLERHMAGEPGHCLTRSAIITTQLLSMGVPARVVQMISAEGKGHTVVEVWDEASGWTVVDPTAGGVVSNRRQQGSAADLLDAPANVQWKPLPSASFPPSTPREQQRYLRNVLGGNLVYPEPWLYLRVGTRLAPRPFRGHFVNVGPTFMALGPAQRALGWAIPGLGLIGLGLIAISWRRPDVRQFVRQESHALVKLQALGDPDVAPPV